MKRNFKLILIVMSLVLVVLAFTGCEQLDMLKDLLNPACQHSGGTATCLDPAVCELCGKPYGEALGHTEVVDKAVAATCTTAGKTEGKHCSVCNEVTVKQTVVNPLGHTEVVDVAVDPTCTTAGKTEGKHCSVCNEVLVAQTEVPALDHSWNDATCTAPKSCSRCDATEGEALGHTEVVDAAVDATCTTAGKTEGKHCSVCNEVLVAQTVVGALGHTEEKVDALAPTCTATGLTEGKKCSVCGEILVKQEVVAALGHTEVVDPAVDATCTETGLAEGKHCSVCGTVTVSQTVTPIIPHAYDDKYDAICNVCGFEREAECAHTNLVKIPGTAATCTATGLTDGYKCGNPKCEEIVTPQQVINALGHTSKVVAGYAATCLENGLSDGSVCSVCGETLKAQVVVPALGHSSIVDVAVDATCTETGLTEGSHCETCGETLVPQTEVPALGHNVVTDAYKAPTCTETGLEEGSHCTRCDDETVEQVVIPALGHSYVYGICSVCDHKDPNYVDYYLIGWINNADYGMNDDWANLGEYKFVDGKLTVTFTADSYVAVKSAKLNGDIPGWFFSEKYVETKEATLEHGKNYGEKMKVPGNVEIVFTLTVNEDGTLTLVADYHIHSYDTPEIVEPTCEEGGYTKHICSCGEFITDTETPAAGHRYDDDKDPTCNFCDHVREITCDHIWNEATCTLPKTCSLCGETEGAVLPHDYVYGICSVCSAKDPNYVEYYLVGYINGADYGIEADYANLGTYKFVDGQLTVTFTADSYVMVKSADLNGENVKYYLSETYVAGKTATLIQDKSEKMFAPKDLEIVYTLTVNEDGTLTLVADYEEKIDTHTYTVAGNMGDIFGTEWDSANAANDMTYDEETELWTKVYENVTVGGNYSFKVCLDHGWATSWGDNGSDYSIKVGKGQTLTITFDAVNKVVNAVVSGESEEPEEPENPGQTFVPLNVYITGDIPNINWNKTEAGKMQPNEDGSVYSITLTFTKGTNFKFHSPTKDWVDYNNGQNMYLASGTYTFYYHRDSDTFGWAKQASTTAKTVYIMGSMNSWTENDSWKLTADETGKIYTGTFTVTAKGEFKMKDSSGNWYGINPKNTNNISINAGTYTFTFYADSNTIAWTLVE